MSSPIADLSYRDYTGQLAPPLTRWWPIAVASMKQGIKKKGFWWWALLSSYGYVLQILIFYFMDVLTPAGNLVQGKNPLLKLITWHDTFIFGFSYSQLLLMILALQIGAPSVANDNRANALLVYLSRPCTKFDYLFGKWLGVFIPITAIVLVQTLAYYGYGALSLANYGFIKQDPTLILRLFPMCVVPGIIHASLSVGISSLFKQGRLASATYSAIYFISLFFTVMMKGFYVSVPSQSTKNLFYCSIDGLNIAFAKLILGTDGSSPFDEIQKLNRSADLHNVPRPDLLFMLPVTVGICAGALFLAWQAIKPVEVVGS